MKSAIERNLPEQSQAGENSCVFRVEGFTCASCAAQFERNVKSLPDVENARVNFGASKITIYGKTSVAELEKAGAFEGLKVFPEEERWRMEKQPFLKSKAAVRTAVSAVLLLAGWLLEPLGFGAAAGIPPAAGIFGLAIVIGGYSLFLQGLRNLSRLQFDIKTLMTIAILGAAALGQWSEGATVVFLFTLSEALESYSMDKARQSIRSLMQVAPKEATIRRDGRELQIPVGDIRIGDRMIVKPGHKIAMDGLVVGGCSAVNQANITGESIPAAKSSGDEVFAGTINGEGVLEVEVTRRAEDTTISKIIHLVEEAQAEQAPSQAFVDRFAKFYTPAVILLALGTAVVPPLLLGAGWETWIYEGLALLVVGCPCALVVSTPVAIVTAIGNAAKHGVLIKGGVHLEAAAHLSAVAFDKTGTLTKGVPRVTELVSFHGEAGEWLGIAAAMERQSHHPLAAAVIRKAEEMGIDIGRWTAEQFVSITGRGIEAVVSGTKYYAGSPALWAEMLPEGMSETVSRESERLHDEGKTVILFGPEGQVTGLIAAADEVRPDSKQAILELRKAGIGSIVMLTGDHRAAAEAVGRLTGVDQVKAELMPQEKLEVVRQLRQSDKVAMVGDGMNDAPALAAADVGIAMGGAGSDTALETADIALMADDLAKLPFTVELSRRTLRIIKQNISFALLLKLLAMLLVIPGWLTLWLAIFADMGATLIVTLNALRLLRVKA
ncbi:heavy metal translocating P-type ATPase [Ferviditalea candida]|uniref:Cd(2+)-exporting ATPase n=1 Tax=Ferviditalea candida TaxID=3108399 RepID=A0ABU5ZM40_9BACL|nr:heavy metal translocating P-type ATPase [Paenibacillaceae bacterium T2]